MKPTPGEQRFTVACTALLVTLIVIGFFLPPIDTYVLPL